MKNSFIPLMLVFVGLALAFLGFSYIPDDALWGVLGMVSGLLMSLSGVWPLVAARRSEKSHVQPPS